MSKSIISGTLGILLVAFILMKVIGIAPVADWSRWLVLIPLWISIGLALIGGIILLRVDFQCL